MFHANTWWSSGKNSIPALYLIVNNNEYKTLITSLKVIETLDHWRPSHPPWYLKLGRPRINFVEVAKSFHVGGEPVTKIDDLRSAIEKGISIAESGRSYALDIHVSPNGPDHPPTMDMITSINADNENLIKSSAQMGPP